MAILVDIEPLSPCCTDHALEFMFKAMADGGGFDSSIWNPHENVFIRRIVELFSSRGLLRVEGMQKELDAWLTGEKFAGEKREPHPRPDTWNRLDSSQLDLLRLYLENLPPEEWRADDWSLLVDYLGNKYLPEDALKTDAEWMVGRSVMMGKIQSALGVIDEGQADAFLSALTTHAPTSLSDAMASIVEYGTARVCENVVDMADNTVHRLKGTILDYRARVAQGDTTATPETLQIKLFDDFSASNRDWRRIAVTEAGELANQGAIASLKPGAKVMRIEAYADACNHCSRLDGKVFTVVSPDKPGKDGETEVWVGKTNVGRSASPRKRTADGLVDRTPSERWWAAAGVQHPHCRGHWEPVETLTSSGDAEFDDWMDRVLGRSA